MRAVKARGASDANKMSVGFDNVEPNILREMVSSHRPDERERFQVIDASKTDQLSQPIETGRADALRNLADRHDLGAVGEHY